MSGIFLDSWWEPSDAAIAWAKTQGFVGWLGYFAQTLGDHIYHGWSDATFLRVKNAGLITGDYDSGLDDPAWVAARNARLGIVGILDVEGSIVGDGAWVDPWMAKAGPSERLYGQSSVMTAHSKHGHPGYIEAGYPSNSGTPHPVDPGLTWTVPLPNPARPIGRQWAGGVPTPFGPVDYSYFDPAFFTTPQGVPMAGGSFKPGTTEYHWLGVNADKTSSQWHIDVAVPNAKAVEFNLGGTAGGPGSITWSPDAKFCVAEVIGSDGKGIDLRVWHDATATTPADWGGWFTTGASTLQLGVQGPPGPQGQPGPAGTVAPFKATITPG